MAPMESDRSPEAAAALLSRHNRDRSGGTWPQYFDRLRRSSNNSASARQIIAMAHEFSDAIGGADGDGTSPGGGIQYAHSHTKREMGAMFQMGLTVHHNARLAGIQVTKQKITEIMARVNYLDRSGAGPWDTLVSARLPGGRRYLWWLGSTQALRGLARSAGNRDGPTSSNLQLKPEGYLPF